MDIGFSTGTLKNTHLSIPERIRVFSEVGATAVEIALRTREELIELKVDSALKKAVEGFSFVSVHAPWINIRYNEYNLGVIKKLQQIGVRIPVKAFVLHPDIIDDFGLLAGIPVAIENMDPRKQFGTKPEELEKLIVAHRVKIVLDLHHAYLHDPSMQIAQRIAHTAKENLSHIHVSGAAGHSHTPLRNAPNQEIIIRTLKKYDLPIILEFTADEHYMTTLAEEYHHLSNLFK